LRNGARVEVVMASHGAVVYRSDGRVENELTRREEKEREVGRGYLTSTLTKTERGKLSPVA
jgi:hypothetical protein